MKMRTKVILGAALLLSISSSYAKAQMAKEISVQENELVPVTLSDSNMNRLFVSNDRVKNITAPAGYIGLQLDGSGGGLVTVDTTQVFTAFVITEGGRQFSIKVTPKVGDGKTIRFNAQGAAIKAKSWEKNNPYMQLMISALRNTMSGQTPPHFGWKKGSNHFFAFNDRLTMSPVSIWQGHKLSVVEYTLYNKSLKPYVINEAMFYKPNVRAVALSNLTVKSNQLAHVYEVLSND